MDHVLPPFRWKAKWSWHRRRDEYQTRQLFRSFGGDKLSDFPAHGMANKYVPIKFERFHDFFRIRGKTRQIKARQMRFRSSPAAMIDCNGAQATRKRVNNVFPRTG